MYPWNPRVDAASSGGLSQRGTNLAGDIGTTVLEHEIRQPRRSVTRRQRSQIAPMVALEVGHAGVPAASVGFEDQPLGPEEEVDPLRQMFTTWEGGLDLRSRYAEVVTQLEDHPLQPA